MSNIQEVKPDERQLKDAADIYNLVKSMSKVDQDAIYAYLAGGRDMAENRVHTVYGVNNTRKRKKVND